jgi:hypothetical protein
MSRWVVVGILVVAGTLLTMVTAGLASAAVLCSTSEPCEVKASGAYPSGTSIKGALKEGTKAVLETNILTALCSTSSLEGKLTATQGTPLLAEVTALSFGSCKDEEGNSCEATALNLPFAASFEASGENNGTFALKSGGSGTPSVFFQCSSFLHCVYTVPQLTATGGNPATLSATKVTLEKTSGFLCPITSKLSVTYALSSPKPAYVQKTGGQVVLCSTSEPCEVKASGAYPSGTSIKGALKEGIKAVLETNILTALCSTSSLEGKLTATQGTPLLAEVTALSFGSCKDEEGNSCEATALNLPFAASFEASGENNGTFALKSGGSGTPSVFFQCSSFLHCVYTVPQLTATGGNPATLSATKVTLEKTSGFLCPITSKLSVTYALSSPKPAYVQK